LITFVDASTPPRILYAPPHKAEAPAGRETVNIVPEPDALRHSLADLQGGHAHEALRDEFPRVVEVFHGRDLQIPPLPEHHSYRQTGRSHRCRVVAKRPISRRQPSALKDLAAENLRRLRRPEPFA